MIRAIVWKEWREQRAIAAAVLVFGVLALALTAQFADPRTGGSVWSQAGARELMAQALAYLAGTVCGAMLLADEKEIGTLEFLDTLPARRRGLWVGKVAFGLCLAILQCGALAGLAIAFGCVDARISPAGYAITVVLIGLLAFAWGLFGGALAKSTLGAVFQGSVGSVIVGLLLAVPFVILFGQREFGRPFGRVLISYYAVWLGAGLVASALVFTAIDRDRRIQSGGPVRPGARVQAVRPARRKLLGGVRALLWLSLRQAVFLILAAFAVAGVLAAVMLTPDAHPLFIWPAATLAFGVLAGVTTLGEEQTRAVARFWAERRLPLGKMWMVKVAFHLGLAAIAALILLVPLMVANPAFPFRTRMLAIMREELPQFLLLSLVYGFVIGHLAGMVFRKTTVASLVAGLVAVTFVGLIYPSVIGGGAAGWQVWGPAVVLLVTARLLLYPWATERVATRGPLFRAVGGAGLAAVLLAAGLAYRVREVPGGPDRLAESGFAEALPTFDQNRALQVARSAISKYHKAAQDHQDEYPGGPPAARPPGAGPARNVWDLLLRAGRTRWEDGRPLGPWLDRVFAEDWVRELDVLIDLPVGVLDDPRDRDYVTPNDTLNRFEEMAAALRLRGLQLLERGDPTAYPRLLAGGLAAVRTARNKGGAVAVRTALEAEEMLLGGLAEWLREMRGRPDLLRPLLDDLIRHERETPVGVEDTFWAEQVILRNTMDRAGSWLPRFLTVARWNPSLSDPHADAEAELVAFAWNVPWERARRERLLRVRGEPSRRLSPGWLSELHLKEIWQLDQREFVDRRDRQAVTARRLAILRVALRLYQFDHGEPAPDLAALVPDYVSAVPIDPFAGVPFRYRISTGEYLNPSGAAAPEERVGHVAAALCLLPADNWGWARALQTFAGTSAPTRTVAMRGPGPRRMWAAAGDAVLWSVGPDRTDDGGVHQVRSTAVAQTGEDWIVHVPNVLRR